MGLNQGCGSFKGWLFRMYDATFCWFERFWNISVCTSLCIFVGLNERLMVSVKFTNSMIERNGCTFT